ncbi:hypothetical protein AURDEDRAFT_170316 [Auricularia subglabra TFB-10046 SS5]|nr:hypothetical protein AURDEDRAFT_170316 [Auricularia subglabra TFB-10046 SS5]
MPIVAFAFGSLGDITALLQLAWQLSKTLTDLAGTSGAIAELISDIRTFARTLEDVERAIAERRIDLKPEALMTVQLSVACGHLMLKSVESKIAAFDRAMTGPKGPGALALRKYWAVASWEIPVGGRKEVNTLQRRLRDHLSILQTNLALTQSTNCSALTASVISQRTTIDKIWRVVETIPRHIGSGVPTFRFFDRHTQAPFLPFTRTTLHRFMALVERRFGYIGLFRYFECSGSRRRATPLRLLDALGSIGSIDSAGAYVRATWVLLGLSPVTLNLVTRIRASHVSRRWRSIALGERHLWNSFSCGYFMDKRHQEAAFEQLAVVLQRSHPLRFNLRIPHRYIGTYPEYEFRIMTLPFLDANRLDSYDGPLHVFLRLNEGQRPLPNRASLNILDTHDRTAYDDPYVMGRGWSPHCLPNLRTLTGPDITIPAGCPPFVALLTLKCFMGASAHWKRISSLFPNLERLWLCGIRDTTRLPAAPLPTSLQLIILQRHPSVQSVEYYRPGLRNMLDLFGSPAHRLHMASCPYFSPRKATPDEDFVHCCDRLTAITVDLEHIIVLMQAHLYAPCITELVFRLCTEYEDTVTLLPNTHYFRAPKLQRLVLNMDTDADEMPFETDNAKSVLATLTRSFRSMIIFDADLLQSLKLFCPPRLVEKWGGLDFVRFAEDYSVQARFA